MSEKYQGSDEHLINVKNASKKGLEAIQRKTKARIENYYINPKLCLSCDQAIPYEKKRENKYCSHSCRAKQINPTKGKTRTTEERKKISLSLGGDGVIGDKRRNYKLLPKTEEELKMSDTELRSHRMKEYYKNNPEAKIIISEQSRNRIVKDSTREKLRLEMKRRIELGIHKGWAKRNKPSYPELFFMKVLDNKNISYVYEKKVGKYFIDFAFDNKMVALEVDGKQHTHADRIEKDKEKDEFLSQQGWKVYRIAWKNINSDIGKEYIKKEIEKFIEFYNSI